MRNYEKLKKTHEELIKSQIKLKCIEILSNYRDWIRRLRTAMFQKMNEQDQDLKSWNDVAGILCLEVDYKVLGRL